jgi:glycosyltransferase involved in cell wall biosynthesis
MEDRGPAEGDRRGGNRQDGNLRIAIPFATPVYRHVNGDHPLLAQLIADNRPGLQFIPAATGAPSLAALAAACDDAEKLATRLSGAASLAGPLDPATLEAYLHSRDAGSQAMVTRDADLAFLHTVPLTLDALPWVLHFESVTTLFWPFLHQGQCRDLPLYRQPIYPLITRILESASARTLFTHCRHTVRQVERIFPETVAAKLRYAPLGIAIPAPWPDRIAAAAAGQDAPDRPFELLFTNSWHQGAENFYNRGGLDVVDAFIALHRECPATHLTLRTSLPDAVRDGPLGRTIRDHPAITLIDQPISDTALNELLLAADVFLLPSASLHSVSLLRAMAFGAVPVVCDIPIMEEFVDDGRTGIVIAGRRDSVLSIDPDSGWEQEDYTAMRRPNRQVVGGLVEALRALYLDPARRRALRAAGWQAIADRFAFDHFRDAFETVLCDAKPETAAPSSPSLAVRLAARLQAGLSLHRHPVAEQEPHAAAPYRTFNVVWYRGRVFGVRQGTGDIDLSAAAEELQTRLGPEDLVIAETLAELYARIDGLHIAANASAEVARLQQDLAIAQQRAEVLAHEVAILRYGPAGKPDELWEAGSYGHFNLFWFGGRVIAVRQSVGAFDPTIDPAALRTQIAPDDLVIAVNEDDARRQVDLLNLTYDQLFSRLRRSINRRSRL